MVHKVDLPRLRKEAVEGLSFRFSWLKHPTKATVSSKLFAWSGTRGTFCLSTGGNRRLVAKPYATAQFYSGHTPDNQGVEMWPIFLVFADIADAH